MFAAVTVTTPGQIALHVLEGAEEEQLVLDDPSAAIHRVGIHVHFGYQRGVRKQFRAWR